MEEMRGKINMELRNSGKIKKTEIRIKNETALRGRGNVDGDSFCAPLFLSSK
jgi:hypothetical protein